MSERLIVKFEKGTGGPLRTAIGDLVPTYIAPPADVCTFPGCHRPLIPGSYGCGLSHRSDIPKLDNSQIQALPAAPEPTAEWGLMLSDVTCDGEFDGVSLWYQIAFSHIITVRPHRDPA